MLFFFSIVLVLSCEKNGGLANSYPCGPPTQERETFGTARILQASHWHYKQMKLCCLASGASLGGLRGCGPKLELQAIRPFLQSEYEAYCLVK